MLLAPILASSALPSLPAVRSFPSAKTTSNPQAPAQLVVFRNAITAVFAQHAALKTIRKIEALTPQQWADIGQKLSMLSKAQNIVIGLAKTNGRLRAGIEERFDVAVHEAAHAYAIIQAEITLPRFIRLRKVKLNIGSTIGALGFVRFVSCFLR